MFDNTIQPIITYSCEIWGYENLDILERIQSEFLRKLFHLKKSTPLYMLYAETGQYPLHITIKSRMIGFWNRLITGKETKLSFSIYKIMLNIPNFESKWVKSIKTILNEVGRSDLWLNQSAVQSKLLKNIVKQVLLDQHLQNWDALVQNSTKGLNYSAIKDNISLENYLLILKKKDYITLIKFRTGNHFLPIETLRWDGTDISDRNCTLCNTTDIGDEFHYLLKCPFFLAQRKKFVKKYYYNHPNMLKYKELMTLTSKKQLEKLSAFIKIIMESFKK